jgi:hypothetical protein
MPNISFSIPQELDISGALTIQGILVTAQTGRIQVGSGSNSTLMASDSGAFVNLPLLLATSGALAASESTDSTITVTGSNPVVSGNLAGLGGTQVFMSGTTIWVSGGAGGSFDPLGSAAAVSGVLAPQIASTGQALYNDLTAASGQLSLGVSGSVNVPNPDLFGAGNIAVILSGVAGVFVSGGTGLALTTNLAATGQSLYGDVVGLSGVLASVSGGLQAQIAGGNGTQVKVSGSSALTTATISGLGNVTVTLSGSTVLISGSTGNYVANFYTGFYTGGYVNFDFRSNIALPINNENPFIPFSSTFGAPPAVVYTITNGSGDGILLGQISGVLNSGFSLNLSAPPPTANYLLSYIATTGTGITLLGGGNAGGGGSYDPLGTAANSGQLLYGLLTAASGALDVANTSLSVTGSSVIASANITGVSGISTYLSGTTIFVSSNLQSSGLALGVSIASLSGYLGAVSGGLQSQIAGGNGTQLKVTGSSTFTTLSISGTGGFISFVSGSTLFLGPGPGGSFDPLGTAASTGQILYNDLVGASGALSVGVSGSANIPNLDFFSAGNVFVTLSGAAGVYVSGGTGLALTTNLAATGSALYTDLVGMSGAVVSRVNSNGGLILINGAGNATVTTAPGAPTSIVTISGNLLPKQVGFTTDAGASVISSGVKGYIVVPYAGQITSWSLVSPQAGSINLDIWKIASGSTLPSISIISGAGTPTYPALAGGSIAYGGPQSWLTTSVALNDVIGWVVTGSPSTISKITFQLTIT